MLRGEKPFRLSAPERNDVLRQAETDIYIINIIDKNNVGRKKEL